MNYSVADQLSLFPKESNKFPKTRYQGSKYKLTNWIWDKISDYRASAEKVNGFTLGAFTGYFRDRKSTKNITCPYGEYSSHYVLGIIYSKNKTAENEKMSIDWTTCKVLNRSPVTLLFFCKKSGN